MTRLDLYRWMATSRALERTLCGLSPRWFPAEGEEATIVGSFCDLAPDDVAAAHYRGPFVVYLIRGAEMWRLICQALGKSAGYNRGRSVPFTGPLERGIVPWVAGDLGTSLGVATGAALAFQQEGSRRVCVCTFGDGTANRGDFHENLNLAACWRLPVVYVCQNNGWSISQPAGDYLPAAVVDRARGYGIPGVLVDGNDVEAVRDAVAEAVGRARRGGGPALIEARTARALGHWAGDTQAYRGRVELPPDPLEVLAHRLVATGEANAQDLERLRATVDQEVAEALERARAEPGVSEADLGLDDGADDAPLGPTAEGGPVRRTTYMEALVEAIAEEMRRDERVFYMGQDVGPLGGPMQATKGLFDEFGPGRVRETPISESAMVGAGIGAALFGRRPIVEVSFGEFLPAAMNQLINQAPNIRYMTGGRARLPLVVRTRVGDGPYRGHPQDYSAWFAHVPGWKVVMPATPADARGLMAAAIQDDGPVLFFEPMSLVHAPRGDVPTGRHLVPIGPARLARRGRDVTLVALGSSVPLALQAADLVAADGIDVEVIDLRTLSPWDRPAVIASLRRTGRLVVVHEAWTAFGVGAEIVAAAAEDAHDVLRAPPARVGAAPVPTPSGLLRALALPTAEEVAAAVHRVVSV